MNPELIKELNLSFTLQYIYMYKKSKFFFYMKLKSGLR